MTDTTFSTIERQTLLQLWDQEDEWWLYFYLLSDRFQEDGDDDGARFIRWLRQWGTRGRMWMREYLHEHEIPHLEGKWFWWTSDEDVALMWRKAGGMYVLPPHFYPICAGFASDGERRYRLSHTCRIDNLEVAMGHYRTLSDAEKDDLDDNWRAP